MYWDVSGFLFDLDGVLVDSNSTSERHWVVWATRHGIDPESIFAIHHGRPTREVIQLVAPHLDSVAEAHEKEDTEADDLTGIESFPGVYELLTALPVGQWAIGTSGKRRTATIRLNATGLPIPEAFITANDIVNGKPNPEPYLKAAALLGLPIEECIVVEDAPSGIQAGLAAGAKVIAVATTNPVENLLAADIVVKNFAAIRAQIDGQRLRVSFDPAQVLSVKNA